MLFKPSKFESPSKGIVLFESCKKRTPENKWAKTNSATDSDDEAGVNYGNSLF
jgi:hypothetical protein